MGRQKPGCLGNVFLAIILCLTALCFSYAFIGVPRLNLTDTHQAIALGVAGIVLVVGAWIVERKGW